MKVAFIRPLFTLGGVETVLYNTAEVLKKNGFKFYAICVDSNGYDRNYLLDNSDNIDIRILTKGGNLKNEENIIELSNIINKEQIDLICYDIFIPNLIETIRNYTTAKVAYWYHNGTYVDSLKLKNKKASLFIKYPILKYPPFSLVAKYLAYIRQKNFFILSKNYIESNDFMFVLDESYKLDFLKNCKLDKSNSDKIKVLINTIELVDSPNINKDNIIVYMGRFDYQQKRVERFVDIWKLIYKDLPDWRLELYGDGDSFDMVKEEIQKAKLERIYLMGRTDNPNEVYDKAAIVAITSQFEGFPMTLVEAQNNGCVPIAFNCVRGIHSIIKGGGNLEAGVLVTPFNIKEYAKKLKNLCLNEEYRKELQKNALIKRNEYTMDRNIPIWIEIKKACGK